MLADEGVDAVDGLLRVRPPVEGRLFLLLSHGSEVYVVGPTGPRLLERRQASAEEAAALTEAAEALRARLAAAGVAADLAHASAGRRAVVLRLEEGTGPEGAAGAAEPPGFGDAGLPDATDVADPRARTGGRSRACGTRA